MSVKGKVLFHMFYVKALSALLTFSLLIIFLSSKKNFSMLIHFSLIFVLSWIVPLSCNKLLISSSSHDFKHFSSDTKWSFDFEFLPGYVHAKRVCNDFKINNLEEYHNLYVQRDTLLLPDMFENFQNVYLEVYEFDHASFLTAPGLVDKQPQKHQSKIRFFKWYGYVINGRKGISGVICHAIHWYAKANNKYMKDYEKIKNFKVWIVCNYHYFYVIIIHVSEWTYTP